MGTTPGLVRPFVQANTVDGGTVQQDGQIIGLNDGGYVIVYNDQSPVFTSGQSVVGQRFDAAGNKAGAELRVSQFDDGQDSVFNGSSITNLHNGNIAFAYTDLFQGDNDVWVRVLNPALGAVRDDAIDTGTAQTKNTSITSFGDGSYAVSYTLDNGSGNTDIMARIVSATGVVGAPITVRDNGSAGADFSQLATLSNNTFVDVYQQKVGLSQDIGLAIYTSAGVLVTQHSVFGADGIVSVDETDPDVAALTGGGFVVAWTDSQGDDNVGGQGPRMSIYDNAGHLVAGDIQIHTSTYLAQNEVSLVAVQDGGFVATWEDDAYVMVRGQRFDAMGEKIGAEFVVKENNFQPVDTQDIALLADGRFAFALGNLSGGDSDVTTSIWSPTSNDAPVITSDGGGWLANLFVAENSSAVTTVTASDPDGPSAPSFAILAGPDSPDAAKFSINAATGVLTFVAAPDFEQPSDSDHDNTYVVQVGASDGNLSGIQTIDVYVTDVAPVITSNGGATTANVAQPENATAVTTVTASDGNGPSPAFSIAGGSDAGRFQINATTGALSFLAAPNFESPGDTDANNNYVVQVRASDGALFDDQVITVNVTNVNEAPVITSNGGATTANIAQPENATAVTTVTASDVDGPALAFSIAGGSDAARFQINATTGALSFIHAPNFEAPGDADANNSYVVQVRASDGSLVDDQTITINVSNVVEPPKGQDFNGDGNGDILWRHSSGTVAEWQMNGSQIAANLDVAWPGNEWHFQDSGDFGGDGMSDVMWRHDNGQVVLWQMDGERIVSNTSILEVSNQYHVQGLADFGGDGKSDVLFRHDNGQVVLWQMDGDKIATNTAIATVSRANHIEGVGDFGGDGKSDVLWRDDSGQVVLWQMDGDKITANTVIGNVSHEYHVQGIGDFNRDGMSDVLWRHDNGQIVLWQMNGDQIVANTQILNVSNQYHVQDVRDYKGDGMSDVLLRHESGQVVLWQMNGDHIASNTAISTVGTDWTIQAHHFDLV